MAARRLLEFACRRMRRNLAAPHGGFEGVPAKSRMTSAWRRSRSRDSPSRPASRARRRARSRAGCSADGRRPSAITQRTVDRGAPGGRAPATRRWSIVARQLLRQFEREAAGEHAEPAEHALLLVRQQAVAPLERGAQRLMAAQLHARAARQHVEALVEALGEPLHAEQRHARRGQLDRQRDAVELAADLDDRRRRCRAPSRKRGSSACARSMNSATAPYCAAASSSSDARHGQPAEAVDLLAATLQ